MIQQFHWSKKYRGDCAALLTFIVQQREIDFYLTENNERVYVKTKQDFKKFVHNSTHAFFAESDGVINGLVLIWKSVGGTTKRNYVKLVARSAKAAEDLLTVVNWNCPTILYVKIHKSSPLLSAFKKKGFRFEGDRGNQVLLRRSAFETRPYVAKDTNE